MTNQLDSVVRLSMLPAASENFSLDETISGSGKKSNEADHQPRNLKIQKLVDEIVNVGNSTSSSRPYGFQRKRLLNDSAELNAADKTSKPFKSLKIQSLLDEIINDSSPEKSPSTISQAIPQNAPVLQKKISI